MENSVIAVQIANGTFVPVLNTESRKRRRLVVTTVRDNQSDVRIELFRGSDESMSDAEYVGSLVIGNLGPAPSGGPDVSVLLGVDESGNLNATARDTGSGEYQSLSANLDQLRDEGGYDVPDFQLSDEELTLDDLSLNQEEISLEAPSAADASPLDDESDELSLDDLSLELDESTEDTSDAASDEEALGDLSFDDFESEPTAEPVAEAEADALEELTADDESDELSELSLEEVTLEPLEELEELDEESEVEAEPATEPAADAAAENESFDGAFAGFADQEISFDESFGEENVDAGSEDDNDFDLSALTEDEGEDVVAEEDTFSFDDDTTTEEGADESAVEGMIEADLGDEDFTFDEHVDDEPLFGEPAEFDDSFEQEGGDELEDTLSPEEFDRLDSTPGPIAEQDEETELAPRRSNAIVFIGYLVLALAALGVLAYLIFRLLEGPPAPPLHAARPLQRLLGLIPFISSR